MDDLKLCMLQNKHDELQSRHDRLRAEFDMKKLEVERLNEAARHHGEHLDRLCDFLQPEDPTSEGVVDEAIGRIKEQHKTIITLMGRVTQLETKLGNMARLRNGLTAARDLANDTLNSLDNDS
jgi:hypothetical protein